jgi:hypothetical protein
MIINLPGAPYTLRSSDGHVFITPNGGEQINLTNPKPQDFALLGNFFSSLAPAVTTAPEPIVEENHSLPSDDHDSGDESSL